MLPTPWVRGFKSKYHCSLQFSSPFWAVYQLAREPQVSIHLSPPPHYGDYNHVPSHLAFKIWILRTALRSCACKQALYTNWAISPGPCHASLIKKKSSFIEYQETNSTLLIGKVLYWCFQYQSGTICVYFKSFNTYTAFFNLYAKIRELGSLGSSSLM